MLGERYTLDIRPTFIEELDRAAAYIELQLLNPVAADKLVADVYDAIDQTRPSARDGATLSSARRPTAVLYDSGGQLYGLLHYPRPCDGSTLVQILQEHKRFVGQSRLRHFQSLRFISTSHGSVACAQRSGAAYGSSTVTLKNRSAAFVGECHAASVKFVLPQIV